MNAVRMLTLAAVAAGAAAEAMHNGTPQGEFEIIEMLPRADHDSTCAELPKLCTGAATMYGHATTVTYLCPDEAKTRKPSTVHVTITKTTTITPLQVESTIDITSASSFAAPAPAPTEEPDITTTVHSTLTKTKTKTVTMFRSLAAPHEVIPPAAATITGYFSATIPTELVPLPTETEDPEFTIQTSTTPAVTPTSAYSFPTMSPPVVNGTTTGIFYSAPVANSSLAQPTPFFPNTTSAHSHYALPTLNVENRAAQNDEDVKGAAGKLGASLATLTLGVVIALIV